MIRKFNRTQILLGGVNLVAGTVILWIAWWFFCYVDSVIRARFWHSVSAWSATVATGAVLLLLVTGFRQWRRGEAGYQVFHDTAFYAALDPVTEGAAVTQLSVHRVTGIAYLVSQFFLAGPRQICTGLTRLRSLLPHDPNLEARMSELLTRMRAIGKWDDAQKYEAEARELGALIRCGLVDFSRTKLRVKAAEA